MSSSSYTDTDKDIFIKEELTRFILGHTGLDELSAIDEIVLSYIAGVLESLGSTDSAEDAFDVAEFAEMMTAYIPSFANINRSFIYEWLLNLSDQLKVYMKENEKKSSMSEMMLFKSLEVENKSCDSTTESLNGKKVPRFRRRSYQGSRSCSSSQSEDEEKCITVSGMHMTPQIDALLELFPHLHVLEAKQCLSMAEGDCDKAVQLILQRLDSGQKLDDSLIAKSIGKHKLSTQTDNVLEDKKLRERILNKYAYIDREDDMREHKPAAPKVEPKKLIRYRDSKIVSVKGERFSEVKLDDEDGRRNCV